MAEEKELKEKAINFFEAISPLVILIVVVAVGVMTFQTQMQAIEQASYNQCEQALDVNFTMEKKSNGWECVTQNGSYEPEIHLINAPETPSWLDTAILVVIGLFIVLGIPYMPRATGGRI